MKDIDRDRANRAKLRRRQKNNYKAETSSTAQTAESSNGMDTTDAAGAASNGEEAKHVELTEDQHRAQEVAKLQDIIKAQGEVGAQNANHTGLYELCG